MRLLVTRPEPDCKRTAERLRTLGHLADEAPLLVAVSCPFPEFDLSDISALAFSSRRAVAALNGHPQMDDMRHLPVFTVGEATAEAARLAGYGTVFSADGDVKALGELILNTLPDGERRSGRYLAAADRAGDLEGHLAAAGLSCQVAVLYRMESAEELPPQVLAALRDGSYDGVLIYSRRTAETLLTLLKAYELHHNLSNLPVYALSDQAGEPLSEIMPVKVAAAPNENALLDLALTQC